MPGTVNIHTLPRTKTLNRGCCKTFSSFCLFQTKLIWKWSESVLRWLRRGKTNWCTLRHSSNWWRALLIPRQHSISNEVCEALIHFLTGRLALITLCTHTFLLCDAFAANSFIYFLKDVLKLLSLSTNRWDRTHRLLPGMPMPLLLLSCLVPTPKLLSGISIQFPKFNQ